MADLAEVERQMQLLRQGIRLRDEALDYLDATKDMQNGRWDQLKVVIDDASFQYGSMRQDVQEEFRDQGAPLWLSVLLIVGVSLIPVSAITNLFLIGLTKTTQKLLVSSAGRARALQTLTGAIERELDPARVKALANNASRVADEFRRTDEALAKYIKNELEPEVVNALQTKVWNVADKIEAGLGKPSFMQDREQKLSQNAPVVVVRQVANNWIQLQIDTERAARKKLTEKIRDLFDIAISQEPDKEAKAKEAKAKEKAAALEPRVPFRTKEAENLPKTNKAALDQLTQLRDKLVPASFEIAPNPKPEDLRDLMLSIESMIWATTYDFTPKGRQGVPRYELGVGYGVTVHAPDTWELVPPPLPEALLKRLTERYIDPDEHKSYKDVGKLNRLGTKKIPYRDGVFGPEVRLSHYFSQMVYPKVNDENGDMLRRFRALKVP